MLHGATVRNPARRGRIREIVFEPGVPWEEFTIVTAKNIPGKNYVSLILNDQPFLADQGLVACALPRWLLGIELTFGGVTAKPVLPASALPATVRITHLGREQVLEIPASS